MKSDVSNVWKENIYILKRRPQLEAGMRTDLKVPIRKSQTK